MSVVLDKTYVPSIDAEDDNNNFSEYDGWYCIRFNVYPPIKCPHCQVLRFYAELDEYHVIVVWEEKDDDELLKCCQVFKDKEVKPEIVEYVHMLGPCMDFYDAVRQNLLAGISGVSRP